MQNAQYDWTQVVCQRDAVCKHKYYRLKACGKSHGQALSCVGDRLLKALCAMLQNNDFYETKLPETATTA